ncbi:MAG TPA: xanthine dehydrogenase family protein molybdopterin-binding subunit [Solirubrobacteraceae bacterium]|nr:xanthine dehydrogenase family protein molybdopterin-binding subunit [Solirubrobacteraceae bacterium]
MRRRMMGARSQRIEDDRLVTGRGQYVGDLRLHGVLDVAFVRSQIAHATVRAVDAQAALELDGVIGVFTAEDLSDVRPVPESSHWAGAVSSFPLARGRVRHVGHAVAVVVARDRYLAEDAAELVELDLEPLSVAASVGAALAPDAVRLYEEWRDNCCVAAMVRDDPAVATAFERHQTVRGKFTVQRQAAVAMEPRGVVAQWSGDRLTVWSSTQLPHMLRSILARMLGLREGDIRVIAPDVGGGFGGKAQLYAEEYVTAWLALRLGRPVRWIEDRYEHMISACHSRDMVFDLEAAVDPRGRIHAIRGAVTQDLGSGEAYPNGYTQLFVAAGVLTGAYRIPHQRLEASAVVTNKTPNGAYRGFGVPEAVFAMERLVDQVAHECGVDRVEVRRGMLIRPEDLPYTTATGAKLESGSHLEAFDRAVELGRAAKERVAAAVAGDPALRVGIGYATYVEGTGASYFGATGIWGAHDSCDIRFEPDGGVTVSVGVTTTGQGVTTMVATVAAQELGIDIDQIRVEIGDTDGAAYGTGCWGSRSTVVASGALKEAAGELREKGTKIAAHLMECAVEDIVVGEGRFSVAGSPDSGVSWGRVAEVALNRTFELPADVTPGLEARATYDPPGIDHTPNADGLMHACVTHNNATHAAVVVVDCATGGIRVAEYIVVQDIGKVFNPIIVKGQVHGGVAQGVAGALLENLPYDELGNPLATSLMDYLLPSACEAPPIALEQIESPAPETALGAKGVGECGVIGPPAAIAGAVQDALDGFGIDRISHTPITPADVLGLLAEAATR